MRNDQLKKLRPLQDKAGIGMDDRELLLDEVQPRDGSQKAMKDALSRILKGLAPIVGSDPMGVPVNAMGLLIPKDGSGARRSVRTLVLTGREGTGKTFLACSALNTVLSWCYEGSFKGDVCYVAHREMDMDYRSAMGSTGRSERDVFEKYFSKGLLVVDEIYRSTKSDYSVENLELLIAKRYAWRRPTVLISNATRGQLFGDDRRPGMFDLHVIDRLRQGLFVESDGDSQRGRT